MNLVALVVRRPVATWMIAIAVAVFGLVSYRRLPLDLMPDLAYPALTVRTEAPGYAPEEVERQVSRRVEEALATTRGLVELESRSRAGVSDVVMDFAWGTDMDEVSQSVREALQTTGLPEDVQRPLILRYDPSQEPVLRVGLTTSAGAGERALADLREEAERVVKRRLEAMDGIAAVRVRGGLERQVEIRVRQDWLAARGVTIDAVARALADANVDLPGGTIREGDADYLVRTLNALRDPREIGAIEIRRADGVRVPIREVATVRETHKDREVVSRLDGREAVELEVYKAADANIVRVAAAVREALDGRVRAELPDEVSVVVLEDRSRFIEASLRNLRSTALLGALLAVAVLFAFLRDFRATAIIGAAIPLSVVATFAPLYVGGVSLNLMSLGGLALGIGMLVDNAVVVLENIQVHRERGLDRKAAAVAGTREVAAAVTASTLTTVSVFLPIAFVEGVAGQVFGDLSLAVVASLLASLAVALFFVPMLAAADPRLAGPAPRLREVSPAARFRSFRQFRAAWRSRNGPGRLLRLPWWLLRLAVRLAFELLAAAAVYPLGLAARLAVRLGRPLLGWLRRRLLGGAGRFQAAFSRFAEAYARALDAALARPGAVLGGAALATLLAVLAAGTLGQSLIPELHQGRFTAEVALPVGTPLGRTAALVAAVEDDLAGDPDIAHLHAIAGSERKADSRPDEGEHTARIMVEMKPADGVLASPTRREARVGERVRAAILSAARSIGAPEPEVRLARPSPFSLATPIEVRVYDDDLATLRRAADAVRDALARLDGLRDVRSSLQPGYPEVRIVYDRDLLHRLGLDTATVAARVRRMVQGEAATRIDRAAGRLDLVVRLDPAERRGLDDLRRLNVNPEVDPPIPLSMVARLQTAEGPSEIRRIDQRRAAVVSANLRGFDIGGQARAIADALAGLDLDGARWELGGQDREMQRSLGSLGFALALAVFLVYVIMASTFESVLHPFVILFSVPLAVVGVVLALAALRIPVSVVVLIGAIVLAGVVVNNAIVLVDTVNRLRAAGTPRLDAIRRGARLRLRPILITTSTTVLGLLPLAAGFGDGAEIQQPLAVTVIAGLSSATLLTLVVIPVVYAVFTRLLERRPAGEPGAAALDGAAPSAGGSPPP